MSKSKAGMVAVITLGAIVLVNDDLRGAASELVQPKFYCNKTTRLCVPYMTLLLGQKCKWSGSDLSENFSQPHAWCEIKGEPKLCFPTRHECRRSIWRRITGNCIKVSVDQYVLPPSVQEGTCYGYDEAE